MCLKFSPSWLAHLNNRLAINDRLIRYISLLPDALLYYLVAAEFYNKFFVQ